jgi:hypothetical protein
MNPHTWTLTNINAHSSLFEEILRYDFLLRNRLNIGPRGINAKVKS